MILFVRADDGDARRAFVEMLPESLRGLVASDTEIQTDEEWFGMKRTVEASDALTRLQKWLVLEVLAKRVRITREAYVRSSRLRPDGTVEVNVCDALTFRWRTIVWPPVVRWKVGTWRRWDKIRYVDKAVCDLETYKLYDRDRLIPLVADISSANCVGATAVPEVPGDLPKPTRDLRDHLKKLSEAAWPVKGLRNVASKIRLQSEWENALSFGRRAWPVEARAKRAEEGDLWAFELDDGRELLVTVHPRRREQLIPGSKVTLAVFPQPDTDIDSFLERLNFRMRIADNKELESLESLVYLNHLSIRIWRLSGTDTR